MESRKEERDREKNRMKERKKKGGVAKNLNCAFQKDSPQ